MFNKLVVNKSNCLKSELLRRSLLIRAMLSFPVVYGALSLMTAQNGHYFVSPLNPMKTLRGGAVHPVSR